MTELCSSTNHDITKIFVQFAVAVVLVVGDAFLQTLHIRFFSEIRNKYTDGQPKTRILGCSGLIAIAQLT